ncbi:hypothetical protein CCS92_32665, partial [Methylobacterium radiotolerans]
MGERRRGGEGGPRPFLEQRPGGDAGALVDNRQAGARMGAAADDVEARSEAVVRPEIQHLQEV